MVKVPLPVQPNDPPKDHVPEMVLLPVAVPLSVNVLPAGDADVNRNWNVPFTLPLKFPLSTKEPLSVSAVAKHGDGAVMVKLLTLNESSPFTTSEVPN